MRGRLVGGLFSHPRYAADPATLNLKSWRLPSPPDLRNHEACPRDLRRSPWCRCAPPAFAACWSIEATTGAANRWRSAVTHGRTMSGSRILNPGFGTRRAASARSRRATGLQLECKAGRDDGLPLMTRARAFGVPCEGCSYRSV
jgi:hypothetical protein